MNIKNRAKKGGNNSKMEQNDEELLEITERKCPKCGSSELKSPIQFYGLPLISITTQGMSEQFLYKCENCNQTLFSFVRL